MASETTETRGFTPPYFPFSALTGLLARVREHAPSRIDRSYLSWLPGITQTYVMAFLKSIGYLDANGRMTEPMKALVAAEPDDEKRIIGELVQKLYAEVFEKGPNATQAELEEVFRDVYGVRGSTLRKGITFFLKAAEYGDVPVSKLFKTPRAGQGTAAPRKPRKPKNPIGRGEGDGPGGDGDRGGGTPQNGLDSLRARYIEMLLKKAESEDQTDSDLLNRIERLLGYEEVGE